MICDLGAAERRLISMLLEEGQEYNPMVWKCNVEDIIIIIVKA